MATQEYREPWSSRQEDIGGLVWRKMSKNVKGCADCQHNKVNNQTRRAPLSPIFAKPGVLPFETVAIDFIVKLPLSNGFDSILTIMDHDCTKAVILIPCNETITAEGVAKLYSFWVFATFTDHSY